MQTRMKSKTNNNHKVHRKLLIIIGSVVMVSFLLLIMFYISFRQEGYIKQQEINNISFENADLIFRRGRSAESFAVYVADANRDFSHIGVILVEKNETFVIHATPGESEGKPDYVRKDLVSHFLSNEKASHFAVYRPKIDNRMKNSIASAAKSYYDNKLLFDDGYDLKTNDKLYCTELVLKAYEHAGIDLPDITPETFDIIVGTKEIIFPSAFIKNQLFEKIYSY